MRAWRIVIRGEGPLLRQERHVDEHASRVEVSKQRIDGRAVKVTCCHVRAQVGRVPGSDYAQA